MLLNNLELLRSDPGMFFTIIPIALLALLPMLVFHEVSHGIVAGWLGDDTARGLGRISLNPLSHLDPVGTIMLLVVGFGWAKPVPVNPYRLRPDPRRGMAIVAAAGPLSNIIMATLFAMPFRLGLLNVPYYISGLPLAGMIALLFFFIIQYNLMLALLNLLPVPPLDGSRILAGILSGQTAAPLERSRQYALPALVILIGVLLFTPLLSTAVGFLMDVLLP